MRQGRSSRTLLVGTAGLGVVIALGVGQAYLDRVVAAENTAEERVSPGERYARIYEINLSRCIFCGYCVEACPCDAIRMDTGIHMPPSTNRDHSLFDKETLLSIPGRDGSYLTANPRHEPGDATHPGIDRERGHEV